MACHQNALALQVFLRRALLLSSGVLLSALLGMTEAQMTLDGSLGPQRTLTGPDYRIGAELGQTRGSNLFHSFGQFNVPTGGSATFTGPATITNILSRVTGGQRSAIDGTLRSEIPGATLYLLNPAGVVFGPNARLDVSGSVHVSTADYLRLADGARFSAHLSETSVLSVAPPAAFGFLSPQPATITVQGSTLQVPAGATLSITGGDIAIGGNAQATADLIPTLAAPGGRIQLVSVASPGEVALTTPTPTLALHTDTGERLGTIAISNLALLDASSTSGGTVVLRGGRLTVENAFIFADTLGPANGAEVGIDIRVTDEFVHRGMAHRDVGFITTDSLGAGKAGDIHITAGRLQMENAVFASRAFTTGRAGDIEVTASTVTVTEGAQFINGTFGSGQGGRVTVRATEAVTLAGTSPDGALASGIRVGPLGTGQDTGNAGGLGPVTTSLTPDGTLGTTITQSGALVMVEAPIVMVTGGAQIVGNRISYDITGGTQPGNGPNLFHSFDRFSLGTNDTVHFSAPSGIENIVSRVTGGQPSVIDGQLQSTIPGANLYLLNPSGVLFGPNATLDVSGSFHVSTADYLRLADGARFSAHLADVNGLSVAPPAAFGFVSPQPAAITIQGSTLQVPDGAILSVIGGDIAIVGNGNLPSFGTVPSPFKNIPVTPFFPEISLGQTLAAPGGQLHLASVAAPGEVVFGSLGQPEALGGEALTRLGTLTIRDAFLDVSGNKGGTVRLRGGRLILDNAFIGASTGDIDGGGIDMRVTADLTMRNLSRLQAGTFGAGRGGDITVEAGRLMLTEGAEIDNSTSGPGPGGNLSVIATDSLTISGRQRGFFAVSVSSLVTNALGDGDAGRLRISTPTLTMDDSVIQALTLGNGRAGNIQLEVGSVTLTGGAQISSSSGATDLSTGKLAVGRGQGGEVRITAREGMTIAGHDQDGAPSGVYTGTSGSGPGGLLALSVPRLHLEGGHIESATTGDGRAGDLMLTVGRLTLAGGARVTSASTSPGGSGQGGNITITATEAVTITGTTSDGAPSALASSTFGSGDAGHVALSTPTLSLDDGMIAARSTGQGTAGEIRLQVRELFRSYHGTVTSESAGSGNAGTLTVDVGQLLLTDGARLSSSTSSTGHGGTVLVTAGDIIRLAGRDREGNASGLFSTTTSPLSGAGAAGTITVNARAVALEGGIIQASSSGVGDAGAIAVTVGSMALTGGGQLASNTSHIGHGGTVTVTATDSLRVSGPGTGLFTRTTGSGPGGDITVQAPRVTLGEGATLSAESTGPGNAGNVTLTLGDTFVSTNGSIATRATQADGGNIQITAPVLVRLRDSAITAEVGGGATTIGGNITIDPQFIVLQNSQIVANAFQGQGGNIRLQAQRAFLADPASQVSASSALGINGQVAIQAPVTSISGAVAPLPQTFAQTAELLRSRCVERLREGTVSRLVMGGRDGVPLEPGSLLLSPLEQVVEERGIQEGEQGSQNPAAPPGGIWSPQAPAPNGLEVECARWMGKSVATETPKRRR
jgi:filamentous hemagglutinin family protein